MNTTRAATLEQRQAKRPHFVNLLRRKRRIEDLSSGEALHHRCNLLQVVSIATGCSRPFC